MLTLLLGSGLRGHAQPRIPGYLGHRSALIFQGSATPNFNRFLAGRESLRVFLIPSVRIERALSRRFTASVGYSAYRVPELYDWQGRTGSLSLGGHTGSFSFRSYSFLQRGGIALVGPYQELTLRYLQNETQDPSQQLFADGRTFLGTKHDLGIGIAIGTQRIWADRWVLDLRLQGMWVIGLQRPAGAEVEVYLDDLLDRRLRRLFGFQIQGGIGWLLPNLRLGKK